MPIPTSEKFDAPALAQAPDDTTTRLQPSPARASVIRHTRTFPALPRQAAQARTWLTAVLGENPAAADAVLCLSELAANSVQHSRSRHPGGTLTITATITADMLRVEVTDQGGPWSSHHAPPGETGRGLQIVSHLSARSGITGTGRQSRTVWFEIDTPATQAPQPATAGSPVPQHDQATAAARDLLIQTAELPRSRRQLETIISQYRALLHALAATPGKL